MCLRSILFLYDKNNCSQIQGGRMALCFKISDSIMQLNDSYAQK